MITIDLFSGLTPIVQLILTIGIFIIIFLVVLNRTISTNLINFLHDLHAIHKPDSGHNLQLTHQREISTEHLESTEEKRKPTEAQS